MAITKDGATVNSIGYRDYEELYLDWVNNFVSIDGFASYHNISHDTAWRLVLDAKWLYDSKYSG